MDFSIFIVMINYIITSYLQIQIRLMRQRSDPNLEQMWLKCSLLEYPALKDDWSKNLGLKSSFWHGIEMSGAEAGDEIFCNPQKVRHCRAVLSVTYLTPITIALETKINRDHHYHH